MIMANVWDIIGDTFGSFVGAWFGSGVKGFASEAGKTAGVKAEKVVEGKITLDQTNIEVLQRISDELDAPYHALYIARLKEAVRVGRDDWMVGLLGHYLEDEAFSTALKKKEALMKIIQLPHDVGTRSIKKLREEWDRPLQSDFLVRLHGLDSNLALRIARRIKEEADEALDVVETNLHAICAQRGWRVNR